MTPSEFTRHCLRTWHKGDAHSLLTPSEVPEAMIALAHAQYGSLRIEAAKKRVFAKKTDVKDPTGDSGSAAGETTFRWLKLAQTDHRNYRAVHALFGLIGEWQEVFACALGERKEARDELGDMLYYLTVLAHEHGLTLDEVMQRNVEKLQSRYPDGEV
jgi:NTP pyrophosphatase (non-canonical NTP hydrolase)